MILTLFPKTQQRNSTVRSEPQPLETQGFCRCFSKGAMAQFQQVPAPCFGEHSYYLCSQGFPHEIKPGKWGTGTNDFMITWKTADKRNDWDARLAECHCKSCCDEQGRFPSHTEPVSLNQICLSRVSLQPGETPKRAATAIHGNCSMSGEGLIRAELQKKQIDIRRLKL